MSDEALVDELAKRLIEVRNGASRQGDGTRNGLEAMGREVLRQMEWARIACITNLHERGISTNRWSADQLANDLPPLALAAPDWKP